MNASLRKRFIADLVRDITLMNGPDFESMGAFVIESLLPGPLIHRGLNLKSAPVKGTVDSVDVLAQTVAEYSSEEDYWEGLAKLLGPSKAKKAKKANVADRKIKHDLDHAISQHAGVNRIVLVNSGVCGPSDAAALPTLFKQWAPGRSVDWYDARRLAEAVTDTLLPKDPVLDRLKGFLPSLKHVTELYALSHTIPAIGEGYAGREDDEAAILQLLSTEKVVALRGMGGVGKTDLACSIAHRLTPQFEVVVWVHADELKHLDEISAYDVTRNGWQRNLLGLLKTHETLLILDNVASGFGLNGLTSQCGDRSRVLVTTQFSTDVNSYTVTTLPEGPDEDVLNWCITTRCPDELARTVRKVVGGHPLALRILNAYVRVDGVEWSDVEGLCRGIADDTDVQYPTQIVAERVLQKHIHTLRKELGFFLWCGSTLVDQELLRHAAGPAAVLKLEKRAVLSKTVSGLVRLHDLVYVSAKALANLIELDQQGNIDALAEFLETNARHKSLPFLRVVHRHHALVERAVRARPENDALVLGYIAGTEDLKSLDLSLLPKFKDGADALRGVTKEATWLRLMLIADSVEGRYRRIKFESQAEALRELEEAIVVFSDLLASPSLDEEQRAYVRHHRGKTFLKLSREEEARVEFEAVIAAAPNTLSAHASRLQLIRILKDDPSRARLHLESILAAELAEPGCVSTDVLLGAVATLQRRHMQPFMIELTTVHRATIENRIKSAAACGYEHPYEAIEAVSQHWAYHVPDLLLAVYEELAEYETGESPFESAQLAKAAGKAASSIEPDRASDYYKRAAALYARADLEKRGRRKDAAEVHILLGDGDTAAGLLDAVPTEQRDRFWLYRRAQSHELQGQLHSALGEIDAAIGVGPDDQYASSMYDYRGTLKRKLGVEGWETDIDRAIELASNEKYRQALENKRQQPN